MPLVEIRPAAYADVVYIARRLRKADAEEIYPHLFNPTPENLAFMSVKNQFAYVAFADGEPVAAWGAGMKYPAVWQCWMFSTDRWMDVALSVTRFIKREFAPQIIATDAVRLDCWSADDHHVAHRWLEMLGFIREATVEDYAANRVTYHCYSITRSRLERDDVLYE